MPERVHLCAWLAGHCAELGVALTTASLPPQVTSHVLLGVRRVACLPCFAPAKLPPMPAPSPTRQGARKSMGPPTHPRTSYRQ